jgi:hypothetical protein
MNQKAELIKNSIPQLNSSSAEWIEWHKNLKSRYGKSTANSMWLKAWRFRGTANANSNELRTYMSGNGVKIDSSFFNKVVDVGDNVIDKVGGILKIGQVGTIVVGSALIIGIGYILYTVLNPNENRTRIIMGAQKAQSESIKGAASAVKLI